MTDKLFFPPGVQREFFRIVPGKPIPQTASVEIQARMDALWRQRNTCTESEIEDIDADMLRIAVQAMKLKAARAQGRRMRAKVKQKGKA